MTQKTPRRVRRRRQAFFDSWAEVERRQIAQANWSDFNDIGVQSTPTPTSPAPDPFRNPELNRLIRSVPIYDQGNTGSSVGYSAAVIDRLRADQGLCPNCGGGSVRNVWGMTNEDAQCINCGAVFNSFERMREMDQGSN